MSCFGCVPSGRKEAKKSKIEDSARIRPNPRLSVESSSASSRGGRSSVSNGKKKESGTGGRKSGTAQCFNFRDMAIASRNFRDLIGEGGFGKVYKGRLDSGEVVAIKQLNRDGLQGNQEFIVERDPTMSGSESGCDIATKDLFFSTSGIYPTTPIPSSSTFFHHHPSYDEMISWPLKHAEPTIIFAPGTSNSAMCTISMSSGLAPHLDLMGQEEERGDRRKFSHLADPLLQGRYPVRCLHHAIAVTAMCLQEQPNFRPIMGDVVAALEYLASQPYTSETNSGKHSPPSTKQAVGTFSRDSSRKGSSR
ncbi:hypothetical protein MRB53_014519 [Persea americana]|uniref:Uncharacterized protein n=1 Tax=Persea americana TaxID=3435 RepID=A0ACC2KB88_PERAE|nr:hypothetical protein MRB53_014519 [Persea americana]